MSNTKSYNGVSMLDEENKARFQGPILMGVDIAREGSDRTAIIFRQGRAVFDLTTYRNKNLMETTDIIHTLIDKYYPVKVFVNIRGMEGGVHV